MKIFQVEDYLVVNEYSKRNYKIERDEKASEKYAVIYFSSNGLYFPNDAETFQKEIIEKNRYEWTRNKIKKAQKHIYVRDLFKQWYVEGINKEINSVELLKEFLHEETKGYKVITIGSSAGGYAATLFGILLQAEYVLAFAAQFTLYSHMEQSNPETDPLLFKYLNNKSINEYFDLSKLIKESAVPIYYFAPNNNNYDKPQIALASNLDSIRTFLFDSAVHGIPFPVSCLEKLIDFDKNKLDYLHSFYKGQCINPKLFSMKVLGVIPFTKDIYRKILRKLNIKNVVPNLFR